MRRTSDESKAKKLCRQWWGKEPEFYELKGYRSPEALVYLGYIESICYGTERMGKPQLFEHQFTIRHKIFVSPDGRNLVFDPPLEISDRGILS